MKLKPKKTDPEKIRQAIRLKNSFVFDINKWSSFPEVDRAVSFFYDELIRVLEPKRIAEERVKTHIKVAILNLYSAYVTDPAMYVAYNHSKRGYKIYHTHKRKGKTYKRKSRYNPLEIGWNHLKKIISTLGSIDLIETHIGYPDLDYGRYGRLSRVKAKPELITLLEGEFNFTPSVIERTEYEELIELRGKKVKKGKDKGKAESLEYKDTLQTKGMRKNLHELNRILDNNCILLNITDDEWEVLNKDLATGANKQSTTDNETDSRRSPIDYSRKVLKRIFNDGSFEKGGRFYGGWWQQIPKACRKHITIGTNATHEIDFSGIHLNIIYAREKIDLPEGYDPYILEGHEDNQQLRKLVKTSVLRILNAENKESVLWSIKKGSKLSEDDLPKEIGTFERLFELIEEKHQQIKEKYFYTDAGKYLQYLDSQLAEKVMLRYSAVDLAILPVHDSFIIEHQGSIRLRACMEECFLEMFNVPISWEIKEKAVDTERKFRHDEAAREGKKLPSLMTAGDLMGEDGTLDYDAERKTYNQFLGDWYTNNRDKVR